MAANQPAAQFDAVSAYITSLESKYELKYSWSAFRNRIATYILQIIALGCTTATTIVAGLYHVEGWPGTLLIVLPALATFFMLVAVRFRVADLWRLREQAEIEFRSLATRGKQRLAAATSEEECGKLHRELEAHAKRIEQQTMISAMGALSVEAELPKPSH